MSTGCVVQFSDEHFKSVEVFEVSTAPLSNSLGAAI